jgi:hypothetical protein
MPPGFQQLTGSACYQRRLGPSWSGRQPRCPEVVRACSRQRCSSYRIRVEQQLIPTDALAGTARQSWCTAAGPCWALPACWARRSSAPTCSGTRPASLRTCPGPSRTSTWAASWRGSSCSCTGWRSAGGRTSRSTGPSMRCAASKQASKQAAAAAGGPGATAGRQQQYDAREAAVYTPTQGARDVTREQQHSTRRSQQLLQQ